MKTEKMYVIIAALFLSAGFPSCDTEQEIVAYPYNDIEHFSTVDATQTKLKGVINGNDIIVYWPPLQEIPATIKPVIAVSRNASVSPASGVEVAFSEETEYVVTAEDGTAKTYTLRPVINYPKPVIKSVDDAWGYQIGGTTEFAVSGEYFPTDTAQVRIFLVDTPGNEFEVNLYMASKLTGTKIQAPLPLPETGIRSGYHYVKIKAGKYTVDTSLEAPFFIRKPLAAMAGAAYSFDDKGKTLSKGSNISFTYSMTNQDVAVHYYGTFTHAMVMIGSAEYKAVAVSQSETSLAFQLPADMPAGNVARIRVYSESDPVMYINGCLMYTWTTSAGNETVIVE